MNRPSRILSIAVMVAAVPILAVQAQSGANKKPLLMPGVTSAVETTSAGGVTSATDAVQKGPVSTAGAGGTPANGGTPAAGTSADLPTPFDPKELDGSWLKFDQNDDGRIDYAAKLDESGHKMREALDFNYDGYFDDFLYYSRGVLVREEIDSNFDRKIDIWVFIEGGVYIGRTEQDKDFDGIPDVIKDYGKKK